VKRQIQLKILDQRIGKEFPLPEHATNGAAGVDLRALVDAPIEIKPGENHLIKTGIAVHIADPGYALFLFARSGLGHKHQVALSNGVGVLDSDYLGEVMISLCNRGASSFTVQPGERVAQMVLMPVAQMVFNVVESFEETARGEGGFGSTGRVG